MRVQPPGSFYTLSLLPILPVIASWTTLSVSPLVALFAIIHSLLLDPIRPLLARFARASALSAELEVDSLTADLIAP